MHSGKPCRMVYSVVDYPVSYLISSEKETGTDLTHATVWGGTDSHFSLCYACYDYFHVLQYPRK